MSIRYAKENDREKREERERERKVEGDVQRGMCTHSKQSVDHMHVRPLEQSEDQFNVRTF